MEPNEPAVEEVLVLRVVDEARRRRVRRAVAVAVIGVVTAGGLAIGLTHRSAAEPTARSTPPPTVGATNADSAARAQILAVARARYASAEGRGPHRTHVEFGRLTVRGDQARLQVNLVCVPLCGRGEEVTLAFRQGSWRIVSARTSWMS